MSLGSSDLIWLASLVLLWGPWMALGDSPNDSCGLVARLDVRNDSPLPRNFELATSGVPLPKILALRRMDSLLVTAATSNTDCTTVSIPAQFKALSRWGAGPDSADAPIQWLQVSLLLSLSPSETAELELWHCPTLPEVLFPSGLSQDALATDAAGAITIDTGKIRAVISKSSPSILTRLVLSEDPTQIIFDAADLLPDGRAGPVLNNLPAENVQCELLENGPVAATIQCTGDFAASPCPNNGAHRPSFDASLTFVQASGDILLEYDVYNECSGENQPRFGDDYVMNWRLQISSLQWILPYPAATSAHASAGQGAQVFTRQLDGMTTNEISVKQEAGSLQNTNWRKATLSENGETVLQEGEAFSAPWVALETAQVGVSAQLAMMRFREPQAVRVDTTAKALAIEFLSDGRHIGVGQAHFNFAKFSIYGAAGGLNTGVIGGQDREIDRDQGILKIERGLLVHTHVEDVNAAQVFMPLPTAAELATAAGQDYLQVTTDLHEWTINEANGQWVLQRNFGAFQWPDYQFDLWPTDSSTTNVPGDFFGYSNYWSATSTELKNWFATGDPKWIWDFSFWMEHLLWKVIAFNPGRRCAAGGTIYHGLGVGVGQTQEGARYRQSFGSDDYFYNMGSDELYVVRPSASLKAAFACAGQTVVNRYRDPGTSEQLQQSREEYVERLVINRQVSQHLNSLRYAAQFADDGGSMPFKSHLDQIMREYSQDNLGGGVFCQPDQGNSASCVTDAMFMNSAINFDVFRQYLLLFGEPAGNDDVIQNALSIHAVQILQQNIYNGQAVPNEWSVDQFLGDWNIDLQCSFGGAQTPSCVGSNPPGGESVLLPERAMHFATLMMAHAVSPSSDLCPPNVEMVRDGVVGDYLLDNYYTAGTGWTKGNAQTMRDVIHGIAVAGHCRQGMPGWTYNTVVGPTEPVAVGDPDFVGGVGQVVWVTSPTQCVPAGMPTPTGSPGAAVTPSPSGLPSQSTLTASPAMSMTSSPSLGSTTSSTRSPTASASTSASLSPLTAASPSSSPALEVTTSSSVSPPRPTSTSASMSPHPASSSSSSPSPSEFVPFSPPVTNSASAIMRNPSPGILCCLLVIVLMK